MATLTFENRSKILERLRFRLNQSGESFLTDQFLPESTKKDSAGAL
jgi:hypothetical protein